MEFESEEEDKQETTFRAEAAVDPEGTKTLMRPDIHALDLPALAPIS